MGLGGALIWTGVVRNIKSNSWQSRIFLFVNRNISKAEYDVYKNNPDINCVIRKFGLKHLYILIMKWWEKYINRFNCQKDYFVDTNNKEMIYWDNFKYGRMRYKSGLHAISIGCRELGIKNPVLYPRIELTQIERRNAQDILNRNFLKPNNYIVVEPHVKSQNSPNKIWDFENWQKLIDNLIKFILVNKLDYHIAQIGMKGSKLLDRTINLTGQTTFRETAYLIENSKFLIAHEGGLVHLARAVNKKSVVLISAIMPKELMAYPENINFYNDVGCKECGLFRHCSFGRKCMKSIQVEDVLQETIKLL